MIEITSTSDASTPINIINIEKARDIPSGASVQLSTLINGNVVPQAVPLSAAASGVRSVCKQGTVLTGSTTTVIKIATGAHNFKVGDFIGIEEGGIAYAITSIIETTGVDAITVGTAIGTPVTNEWIYEMAAEAAATTSAFLNVPVCISGKAFTVDTSKVMEAIPAYVGASVVGGVIGTAYLAYMNNIDEISY